MQRLYKIADFMAVKVAIRAMILERYCATMKYRIKYEKIERCGQKGSATPG